MKEFLRRLLDLLFPPRCPFCDRVIEREGVCGRCEKDLPWVPDGDVVKTEGGLSIAAPLYYKGRVREGILRFKFRGADGASGALGTIVARCASEYFGGTFDTVTWVPVSGKRLRRRGYDQSKLLALAACAHWGVKPLPLLEKIADNPAQSGIRGVSARRANVLGVYDPVHAEKIRGAKVLLVDDVVTTGATARECARVLRDAGAEEVVCVCLARAESENSQNLSCNREKVSV